MKKIIVIICLISFSFSAFSQDKFQEIQHYKFFKLQLDGGLSRPAGNGSKTGVLLGLEPKINLSDAITVGLRLEATAMARGFLANNTSSAEGEFGAGFAILATGDYYFTNKLVRPFIGAGSGVYNFVSVQANTNTGTLSVPAVTKLGGMLRAGVEVWHFRAGFHYNFVGKTDAINNNYYGLTIAVIFGGGVKEAYRAIPE